MYGGVTLGFINGETLKGEVVINALTSLLANAMKRIYATQELEEGKEWFRQLFESAPDAIYLYDLKGRFIDGNLAAEEMIGGEKAGFIGKSFLDLDILHAKDIPKIIKALAQNRLGFPVGPLTLTLNCLDNRQVLAEMRAIPIVTRNKTVVLGIARDIGNRK
ncbi:MAG TPA: PAS domain S-box protein [Methanoregulaceae archaeon]|nr:PAS domain S-box protein [Methanoregulaceae archaeon]